MKIKTSITLSEEVLLEIDKISGETRNRSAFIEIAIRDFLKKRAKKIRDERHGPTSWISITLSEGKFRQVRKMTAKVGFPTLRLVRIRIANTRITNFNSGEVKKVKHFLLN